MATPTTTLRPLSCWKSLLRHRRQIVSQRRSLSLWEKSVPIEKLPPLGAPRISEPVKHINCIAPPPSNAQKHKEPIKDLTASQIAILDPSGARTHLFSPSNSEAAKVGDVLLVRLKTGDPFAGVCINIRRRGIDSGILLRGQLTRVGVEMWYKIYSPNVEGIEVVQRKAKRARRARLTYMRKAKHDMGSVQKIVLAYQKTRGAVRGSGGNSQKKTGRFEPKRKR